MQIDICRKRERERDKERGIREREREREREGSAAVARRPPGDLRIYVRGRLPLHSPEILRLPT
jgi:hypothetical protein